MRESAPLDAWMTLKASKREKGDGRAEPGTQGASAENGSASPTAPLPEQPVKSDPMDMDV